MNIFMSSNIQIFYHHNFVKNLCWWKRFSTITDEFWSL